ncbi:hypothetical protein [Catellatospora chokoriensis]|uniref:Type VII secretion system (Wss) protein ESAT-6 n=1 Tax=Catellatospora chokoriensis TaxID=310353 RepID=A0A8J3JXT4_9ACTN|nr:hypothetical protein [Catellatospora chokoriensis]GIF90449.1 hypothetical protein Cch02nite_38930 [Catellatospora chokoriensis]
MTDPTRHLTTPVPQDENVDNGFVNITELLDYLSPAAWLNELIEELTGHDVTGTLVKPLAGDWAAISAYGDALKKLSQCFGDIATDVQANTIELDRHWHGNAADSAYLYYSSTAASLSSHAQAVHRAGIQYQKLAVGMWQLAEQLKSFLQQVCDKVLLAAAYAAAGTVAAETVVGGVIGYALAAAEVAKALQLINKCSFIVQTANMAVGGFVSTLRILFKEIEALGDIPTPGAAYDHPMVR